MIEVIFRSSKRNFICCYNYWSWRSIWILYWLLKHHVEKGKKKPIWWWMQCLIETICQESDQIGSATFEPNLIYNCLIISRRSPILNPNPGKRRQIPLPIVREDGMGRKLTYYYDIELLTSQNNVVWLDPPDGTVTTIYSYYYRRWTLKYYERKIRTWKKETEMKLWKRFSEFFHPPPSFLHNKKLQPRT